MKCSCGGKYCMRGYEGKRYYYVCNKCGDKSLVEFILRGIKGSLEKLK